MCIYCIMYVCMCFHNIYMYIYAYILHYICVCVCIIYYVCVCVVLCMCVHVHIYMYIYCCGGWGSGSTPLCSGQPVSKPQPCSQPQPQCQPPQPHSGPSLLQDRTPLGRTVSVAALPENQVRWMASPFFLKKRSFLVMRLQRSQSKINPFCFKFPKCFFFNVSLMFFFWVTFSKSVFSVSFFLQTIAPKAVKLWRGPWTQPQPKPRQPQPDRKPCSQPQPH